MGKTTKDDRHVLCIEDMDLADTAELQAIDDLPRTPAPRRVSELDAHPAWQSAMESLRRQFCAPSDHGPFCFCADCLSRANTPRPVQS